MKKEHKHESKKENEFEHKFKEQEKKLEEYKTDLQRIQAEFENYQKRTENEMKDYQKFSTAKIVAEFLPIIDSFEEAEKVFEKKENSKDFLEGLALIKKQFVVMLEKQGLKFIESKGKKFDPELHECLITGKDKEKNEDIVLEEFQKGYLFNGRVLRHSKVKINRLGE